MTASSLTKIKPIDNRDVPDPYNNDLLPPEGRKVELNQYWHRRLRDGDIKIVEESEPKRGKSDNK